MPTGIYKRTPEMRATMFKKGQTPWNKGKPMSDELKMKVSVARKGKGTGRKAVGLKKGEEHWNWKGGITPQKRIDRQRFRDEIQQLVFQRDDYTCQVCEQHGGSLQVDHIKKWADYPELRFELDNCRTLCMACHYYVTFKRKLPQGVIWGHNSKGRIA